MTDTSMSGLPQEELLDQDRATYTAAQVVASIVAAGKESERLHQRQLARSERLRENADFHLGQEMARRQLAEKETAELRARVAELEKRLNAAAMARVWTNEDGKKFVFADDIKGPLLGKAALRGRALLDDRTAADGEATHWKRLGIDPPQATP